MEENNETGIRFIIITDENDDFYTFKDKDNILKNHQFKEVDYSWYKDLEELLNRYDKLFYDLINENINNINKRAILQNTILSFLNEEIQDCEETLLLNEEDKYTEGKLYELQNLMNKIL